MLGRRTRADAGETLVEVLISVVILGLAGVAVMAGLGLSAKASDIHRKETTSGAYVRSYAEAIENYVASDHYQPCAAANAYNVGAVATLGGTLAAGKLILPNGFTATHDTAVSVGAAGAATGCSPDTGLQKLTLHVASPDTSVADETLVIVVRKPCDPSVTACTS
jgi:type II secretory pathway pseudopilin PulG